MLYVDIAFVFSLSQKEYHVYSELLQIIKQVQSLCAVAPSSIASVTASEMVGVVSSRKAIFESVRYVLL